jgi:hypothetical protein
MPSPHNSSLFQQPSSHSISSFSPASPNSQQQSSAAATAQQQQNQQANRSIAANPSSAFELNELARTVELHPPNTAAAAAEQQQQQPSTSAEEAASPRAAATAAPKVAPQAAQMVQAGVQLRNAGNVSSGKDGRDEDGEDAVGAAVVIIPISRAEMEAATQAAAEPQQVERERERESTNVHRLADRFISLAKLSNICISIITHLFLLNPPVNHRLLS